MPGTSTKSVEFAAAAVRTHRALPRRTRAWSRRRGCLQSWPYRLTPARQVLERISLTDHEQSSPTRLVLLHRPRSTADTRGVMPGSVIHVPPPRPDRAVRRRLWLLWPECGAGAPARPGATVSGSRRSSGAHHEGAPALERLIETHPRRGHAGPLDDRRRAAPGSWTWCRSCVRWP